MTIETSDERKQTYPEFSYINEYNMKLRLDQNEKARQQIANDKNFDTFDSSIADGVFTQNKDFLPGGRYFESIKDPIANGVSDIATVFDIGTTIGYDICREKPSPKARIVGYLNTMASLDFTKMGLIGVNSSTATTNGIADYVRLTIASELPVNDSTSKLIEAMHDTFKRTAAAYPKEEIFEWMQAKMHFLKAVYTRQYNARNLVQGYSENLPEGENSTEELKKQAAMLTVEAMQHRKYGTKPAYIEASIGGSWIFYDGDEWRAMASKGVRNHSTEQNDAIAATVFHSPFKSLKSLKASFEYDKNGVGIVTGGLADAQPDTQLFIYKDGSIGLDPEGIQDVAFLGVTKPQELALRAEIASIFYDLSMPIYKNRPERKNFATLTSPEKDTFDPIQDLLIPRIRYIGNIEGTEESDVVRTIREHDVTWFVRTLPNGYHASPEALAEATQYGIVLEENETFVRSHTRGSAQKVLGYRAIKRILL